MGIVQKDESICFLCGAPENNDIFDKHHCFGGALRKKSEKYGLTVKLHHNECHIFGPNAVHNCADSMEFVHKAAQKAAMKHYGWSQEDFRREFYKSYL